MPVTFPSHAAAVLPLHHLTRGRLRLLPLIAGSCAPDLAYALTGNGDFSHSLVGLGAFCVPAGLALYLWLERLALPALRASLPGWAGRFLVTRGLPAGAKAWALAALAVLLGAATHLLWDGLTHRFDEPAASLYGTVKVDLGFREVHLTALLQHGSSLLGAAAFLLWAWRRRGPFPAGGPGNLRRLGWLLAGAASGGAVTFAMEAHAITSGSLHWGLWLGFWMTLRGAAVGFSLACAAVVLQARSPGALSGG